MSKLALLITAPIALVVLAAHFWRGGDFALALAALALVALLFVRRPWAARIVQIALALGALEWLRTLAALVAERHAAGVPFVRLALILGAVAIVTALCALAFQTRAMRARYRLVETSEAISDAR
jgi:predicted secreted protein